MYIIYRHWNKINGKSYIGQTCQTLERRARSNGSGYKSENSKFWRAIQKYGWENFEHEILEDNIKTQEEANIKEQFWIALFDSEMLGYNSTPGGNNYVADKWKDPQYRNKMCESFSKARKKKWSEDEKFKETSLNNLLTGLERAWNDPKWRAARIENITGNKNPNSKAVRNIDTGKEFSTIKEAAQWAGLKSVSGIGQCCRGERYSSGKHPETGAPLHWEYVGGEVTR